MANKQHIIDFKTLLDIEVDNKDIAAAQKKLMSAFGQLKIAVDKGMAESVAKQYVEVFNGIFAKANMKLINADDLLKDFKQVANDVMKAFNFTHHIDTSAFKGIETSLDNILSQVTKIANEIDGAFSGVSKNIKETKKDFDDLIKKRDRLESTLKSKRSNLTKDSIKERYLNAVSTVDVELVVEGDEDKIHKAVEEFDDASTALKDMINDQQMNIDVMNQWIKAAEKLKKIYNGLRKSSPASVARLLPSKQAHSDLDYITGGAFTGQNKTTDKGRQMGFLSTLNSDSDAMLKLIEQTDYGKADAEITSLNEELKKTNELIETISEQHPEFIDEQKVIEAEKLLKRISKAYTSLLGKGGKFKGVVSPQQINQMARALNYNPIGKRVKEESQLQNADKRLSTLSQDIADAGEDVIKQSKAIYKFVLEYESQLKNPFTKLHAERNTDIRDVYDGVKGRFGESEAILRGVLDMAQDRSAGIKYTTDVGSSQVVKAVNELSQKAGNQIAQEDTLQGIKAAVEKFAGIESSTYSAMSREDAANYIAKNYDHDIWDNWYSRADDTARTSIATTLESDVKLRNAALNQMYDEYKHLYKTSLSFEEFLKTEIPLYRGRRPEDESVHQKAMSFTLDPKAAESFGEIVLKTMIRPIDTLGIANPTMTHQPEAEVLVSNEHIVNTKEYVKWQERLASARNDVSKSTKEVEANTKLAITYDQLKEKLEAYYDVKREAITKHYAGQDITDLGSELRKMEWDITKYFDKNNPEPTKTPSGYTMMLQDAHSDPNMVLDSMCKTLGIEIPRANDNASESFDQLKQGWKAYRREPGREGH